MKKIFPLLIIALLAGAYFLVGPNIVMGGPTKNTIIQVTRDTAQETAPSAAMATAAKNATFTPKGICNKQGAVFACIVEMELEGFEPQTFITELQKDATGTWSVVK